MSRLEIWGVPLPGEVRPGDDLAALLAAAEPALADGDVLVVTSKVVGKAEGRLVPCPPDPAGREAARQAAVAAETVRVVAARDRTRIVETRHGFVLAAAGVDASNTAPDTLVLLPVDPDASARRLRDGLRERLGVEVAVVVSDTFGRPWRRGLVDVAVGAAGIDPLRDYRGAADGHGNPLAVTEMADVDALAAATELVKGKLAGVPAAVVRGFAYGRSDAGVRLLVRPPGEDMFRLGTAEARAEGRAEGLTEGRREARAKGPREGGSEGPRETRPEGPRAVLDGLAAAAGTAGEVGLLGAPPGVLPPPGGRPAADPVAAVLRDVAGWDAEGGPTLRGPGRVTVFYQPDARQVLVQCRLQLDLVPAGVVTARLLAALAAAGVPAALTRVDGLKDTGPGYAEGQTVAVVTLGPPAG